MRIGYAGPRICGGWITGGNTAVVTQVIDDPANPGQFTIQMLGGAKQVPWGQMANFPGLVLTPPSQGGHGLQVWWMYAQAGSLQVKAPPGTNTAGIPAGSPVTAPPVAPGDAGSGLPKAPPGGGGLPKPPDWVWEAALVVLALVAVGIILQVWSAASTAKRLAGGK